MPPKRAVQAREVSRKSPLWKCPKCARTFRQKNQRHSCGIGRRGDMLAGKPPALIVLFTALERELRQWPGVEIVMRGRYVLLRTTRIFADLVFTKDALRLAILLRVQSKHPRFIKVLRMSNQRVAHVTLVRTAAQLRGAMPYVKRAYRFSVDED